MGAVYLAPTTMLGERVALKVISSAWATDEAAMVERFRREVRGGAQGHASPNVIRIHDLGEARPGLLYLSMEYFAGRTLAEVITSRGLVPIDDGARHPRPDLRRARRRARRRRGPPRPQAGNVLVGERDAVKIIDFGLAKATVRRAA